MMLAVSNRMLSFWCLAVLNDLTHGGTHIAATRIFSWIGSSASILIVDLAHTSAGVVLSDAAQNASCSACEYGQMRAVFALHLALHLVTG